MVITRELTVIAMTVTAIASYGRVFEDWSFLGPALAFALAGHALSIVGRHYRWPLLLTAAVLAIVVALATGLIWFSETLSGGVIPSAETLRSLDSVLRDSWSTFGDISAPARVDEGFVISLAVVGAVIAFLADWAAFRLSSPLEAIAPSAVLWFVPSLFSEQHQAALSIAYLTSVLTYGLVQRWLRREASAHWLGASTDSSRRTVLASGLGCVAVAALAALMIAPAIPGGTEATASVGWRDVGDSRNGGTIISNSPLVDIRSQLVDLADTEVFTVATTQPDYWRLTSVDKYEDGAWRPDGKYAPQTGPLAAGIEVSGDIEVLTQTVSIEALKSIWVPAAYAPTEIIESDVAMLYDSDSGSLIVGQEGTQAGMTYTLRSSVPVRGKATIESASQTVPDEIADRYLELPDDFSDRVEQTAIDVTAGAETAQDKAYLLMNFFLDEFDYDINVDRGHDIDRIETFLEVKLGYCEQFASAYAAMARSIGLPTRVAVGYTTGEWDEATEVYRVSGKNAHAWPEVFLGDVGWVRFDPTPTRGSPGETDFTGVAPGRGGGQPLAPGETTRTTTAPTTTPAQPATTQRPRPEALAAGAGGKAGRSGPQTAFEVLKWTGVAAVLFGAVVALLAGWVRIKRRRYLDAARTSAVTAAWRRATSSLRLRGTCQSATETPLEFARRIETGRGEVAELAELITLDRYGDRTPAESETRVRTLSDSITARALDDVRSATRLRWWLDPRSVR